MIKIIRNIIRIIKTFFMHIKSFFASFKYSDLLKNSSIRKSLIIILAIAFLMSESFAWLYDEYAGAGALLRTGSISHEITQYDQSGVIIEDDNETQTIMYSNNMSNISVGTKYIEVKNVGTLDMEFSLAFTLEGHYIEVSTSGIPSADLSQVAGVMYYRLYEVTDEVNSTFEDTYDTKLEAYAASNQPSSSMENDTAIPIRNMTLLNNYMKIDTVTAPDGENSNSRIYRFDYGMYQAVNTSLYSDSSLSIHINAYSSQVGVISAENREGQIWDVQNETQLREVLNSVISGDTIRLINNISLAGSLNITKRINLDLNDFNLTIAQDLIYEYNNIGNITIDASGYGTLNIGESFLLNTPKSNVTLIGSNNSYDVVVGDTFTANTLQDGEEDGLYLDSCHIVKSTTSMVPVDLLVDSNTRITIGTDVVLGNITAVGGSTNIEVINNGSVTQLDFAAMTLLETYTKPQIYVYNLGEIYGVLGSYGILLPETATPYREPNNGNTLIIKGITSGDITVNGSENFNLTDIQTNLDDVSVLPIDDEDHAYIVYIKAAPDTVENLLEDYFELTGSDDIPQDIANIKKLVIWTLNAQYFEAEDFVYVNSNNLPQLEYLSLHNSRVTDGTTNNKIPDYAFQDKTSLETIILPRTVTEIGDYAFSGDVLGNIPGSPTDEFNFVTIPGTVNVIGNHAFDSSVYVKFASSIPPTIGNNAFSENTKIFVPNGSVSTYSNASNILPEHVYISGNIDDNRNYIVFDTTGGVGISYVINNYLAAAATSLGIPDNISYQNASRIVNEIGNNSYREMNINNEDGVSLSLPYTITKIYPYAFYQLNLTAVNYFTNVNYIGEYSFYETNVIGVTANNATFIGSHAFYNTPVEIVQLNSLQTVEDYAFANTANLYEANVGTVSVIGDYAFYNCPNMQRFYINNSNSLQVNNTEEISLIVGTQALFYNWGAYIDGRLRMYVPDVILPSTNTVLSLYKAKFSSYSNYIYVAGIESNKTYEHYTNAPLINPYTLRVVTVKNQYNSNVTGYEIVSYQGEDLNSNIPTYMTINGVGHDIVSIGEGAYQNARIASGYSFNIESEKLLNIAAYAFKGVDLDHAIGKNLINIGTSAFEESNLRYGYFDNLDKLENKAFYNCQRLYRIKLGKATFIGSLAIANTPNLTSAFFTNTLRAVSYSSDSFDATGTSVGNRFRMYVPDDRVDFYQGIYASLSDYVYPTGTIVGHYNYQNFDIGQYSVREVTKPNALGENVTGYEIIEYHGQDLGTEFNLPDIITPANDAISLSYTVTRPGGRDVQVAVTMVNTGDLPITDWEVDVQMDGGLTGWSGAGVTAVNHTDEEYITFKNANAVEGRILPGGTKTKNFHLKSTTNQIYDMTVLAIRATVTGAQTYNVISIGDNAFSHASTASNAIFNFNSDNMLYIGKSAFANISGIRQVTFNNVVTIDNSAFENSNITQASFNNLNYLGDNAFKNSQNLYKINLGKVQHMGANSITNALHLYQIFFDVPNTIALDINSSVFSSIGTSTSDRMRIYVKNGSTGTEEYVDVYKNHFPVGYQEYFYSYDNMVGNYFPPGLIDNIDIGTFSVKNVTIGTSTGYEIVEYHGDTIDGSYEFPTLLDVNDRYLVASAEIESVWVTNGIKYGKVNVDITNTGTTDVDSYRVKLSIPNAGALTSSTYDHAADVVGSTITIYNSTPNNGQILAGETKSLSLNVTYTGASMDAVYVLSAKQNTSSADEIPVISIGDYAFGHASFDGTAAYDVNSTYLINIGVSAFQNNTGIRNINVPNCLYVNNNAFYGATNLRTATFESLTSIGDYAFYNNTKLIILDIGNTSSIGISAFSGNTNVARLTMRNRDYGTSSMSISIGANAFANFGSAIGNRLRIYVPNGTVGSTTYLDAYKAVNALSSYSGYMYVTGEIIGSSMFDNYDIGEYSVLTKTINGVTGYEIIEYHGENINSNYVMPATATTSNGIKNIISIGKRAFIYSTFNSNTNLQLSQNITYVDDYAFYQRSMKTLSANELVYIGKYAFAESSTLTTVTFNSVNTVDEYAFYHCTSLVTINLGSGVTTLANYSFFQENMSNVLAKVYINTATPPTIYQNTFASKITFWGFVLNTAPTIYVPNNSEDTYSDLPIWENYTIRPIGLVSNNFVYELIKNDTEVRIIGYNGAATDISVPETIRPSGGSNLRVTQISANAFDYANSSSSISIPRYVRSVGNGFLKTNTNISAINVATNNLYLASNDGVLYSKDFETLIRFPNGKTVSNSSYDTGDDVKVIANGAFANNSRIVNFTFGENVIAISDSAFTNAIALRNVIFNTANPPYVTGFEFLPANAGLTISYPLDVDNGNVDRYINSTFYAWYLVSS